MKNFNPSEIAGIYCRGHGNLPGSSTQIGSPEWADDTVSELKQIFGEAGDRFSLSSAESRLAHMGFDQGTINGFTSIVEKIVQTYKTTIADDMNHWPEFTFDRSYFLGFHINGKPLEDEVTLLDIENHIRRELTLQRFTLHKMDPPTGYGGP
ncbi:MAG TPA: hypothetical protein VFS88_06750 [Micavibrio sp.]|nr:hypothetical protein [Micavibrio sp.]